MVSSFKYLIVDDEEISRLSVESEASKFPFLTKVASCSHAVEAFEFISRFKPDIVFADIEMPGMSGLELIRSLSGQVSAPVFITSHPEFAVESYEIEAFDYLLKPLNSERFEKCALRLHDFFELKANAFAFNKEQESGFIIIKQGHDKHKLSLQHILYLEAMKDYTRIVTDDKKYLVLGTLTGMHEQLPAEKFVRIHRSYIINREKISTVKGHKIYINEHELPVGKLYKVVLSSIL
ncbi:MAG TPA: LytTR family DNA-binding domain-containing protein [Puia sp.]|jgi:DNA-binding LytR/AlgR family response regulator|nr:LytTR family DNA-binding domain-containing protein [Puia sp.]